MTYNTDATAGDVEKQYQARFSDADRFRALIVEQLNAMVANLDVALASPIASRIKDLSSIRHKLERKEIATLAALNDLIGVRIVVLFQRDLQLIHDEFIKRFIVHGREDTGERLSESQFGYKSVHYIVSIRNTWLELPTLAKMGSEHCEIQVRTMAQHIWAAASHKLQYKTESTVPTSVRRAISRVSALLETVDLEFERVLQERDIYRAVPPNADEPINVENVRPYLEQIFPDKNKETDESYAALLADLQHFGKKSVSDIKALLSPANIAFAMSKEAEIVAFFRTDSRPTNDKDRLERGIYYTHVGLARLCLENEFGEEWYKYNMSKQRQPGASSQITE